MTLSTKTRPDGSHQFSSLPLRLEAAAATHAGRVRVLRKSQVECIEEKGVSLSGPEGNERFGNDAVLVCIGGELPTDFLRATGLKTEVRHGEP